MTTYSQIHMSNLPLLILLLLVIGAVCFPQTYPSRTSPVLRHSTRLRVQRMMTVMSSATVKLQVQYCGGCGFERYYSDLKGALEREFPGQVEVISVKDEDMTGNFEITLMGTNQLIHSKTKKGMGKCESSEERQKLFAIVKLYLDFLSKKSAI